MHLLLPQHQVVRSRAIDCHFRALKIFGLKFVGLRRTHGAVRSSKTSGG